MTAIIFSFKTRDLGNGYTATQYTEGGTFVVYHESNPRKAVWEEYELKKARAWAKKHQHCPKCGQHHEIQRVT